MLKTLPQLSFKLELADVRSTAIAKASRPLHQPTSTSSV